MTQKNFLEKLVRQIIKNYGRNPSKKMRKLLTLATLALAMNASIASGEKKTISLVYKNNSYLKITQKRGLSELLNQYVTASCLEGNVEKWASISVMPSSAEDEALVKKAFETIVKIHEKRLLKKIEVEVDMFDKKISSIRGQKASCPAEGCFNLKIFLDEIELKAKVYFANVEGNWKCVTYKPIVKKKATLITEPKK